MVSLSGFGLRDASDGLVVTGEDRSGRILGGLADQTIDDHLAGTESPVRQQVRATISDPDADAAGMVCGGTAHLLITPVADLPVELAAVLTRAEPVAIVTAADGTSGELVVTERSHFGAIGGDTMTDAAVVAARQSLQGGQTDASTVEVVTTSLLINTIVPATRALIVGSGPMADAIEAQGSLLGWDVTVDERVLDGRVFCASAGPADAIIILSHDRAVDMPLLIAALDSPIGYIGAMGSRGTQTARRTRLAAEGYDDVHIARVHGPVGLDLGSRTPAETAVAIVAEFLASRSGRAPTSLNTVTTPIH